MSRYHIARGEQEIESEDKIEPGNVHSLATDRIWLSRRATFLAYGRVMLVVILAVLLPTIFLLMICVHGDVVASDNISRFVQENPRSAAFLVTIFSSVLSGLIRWGYGSAVTLFTKKRLVSDYREIAEIGFMSALKHGGLQLSRRRYAALATTLTALAIGLLTGGFVYLLSPLYTVSIPVYGLQAREFDFASEKDLVAQSG
ncbi:hypothetical protein FRC03_008199 [Tulasnella sp. 419]|nr:hypothetical protein FRC03_008199 [Tulasnella sp. 419]